MFYRYPDRSFTQIYLQTTSVLLISSLPAIINSVLHLMLCSWSNTPCPKVSVVSFLFRANNSSANTVALLTFYDLMKLYLTCKYNGKNSNSLIWLLCSSFIITSYTCICVCLEMSLVTKLLNLNFKDIIFKNTNNDFIALNFAVNNVQLLPSIYIC